jgi:hypothetical protein
MAELVDLAVDEPAAPRADDRPQFLDQGGLADAGRAGHQDAAALALGRRLEGAAHGPGFLVPPNQPRRCQLPREIVLAQWKRPVLSARQRRAEPRQIMGQALGALIAAVRFLFQQVHADGGQSDRYSRIDRSGSGWHRREMIADYLKRIVAPERQFAGSQLIKRDAERTQIGMLINRARHSPGLLRGKIAERSGDLAVMGEAWTLLGERGGQVKINQYRPACLASQQDVARIDVLVQHAQPMDRGEIRARPWPIAATSAGVTRRPACSGCSGRPPSSSKASVSSVAASASAGTPSIPARRSRVRLSCSSRAAATGPRGCLWTTTRPRLGT